MQISRITEVILCYFPEIMVLRAILCSDNHFLANVLANPAFKLDVFIRAAPRNQEVQALLFPNIGVTWEYGATGAMER